MTRSMIMITSLLFLIILSGVAIKPLLLSSSVAALMMVTTHRCCQRNSYSRQYNRKYSRRHKGRLFLFQQRNSINIINEDDDDTDISSDVDVDIDIDADADADSDSNDNNYLMSRRKFIPAQKFFIASVLVTNPMMIMNNNAAGAAITEAKAETNADVTIVEVPLEYISTLNAYIVRYTLFDENFAAIIDTGSPFLTVPSYCKQYRNQKFNWGCYRPEKTTNSGYENTIEGYDNSYGTVVWRKAKFSFYNNTNTNINSRSDDGVNDDEVSVSENNNNKNNLVVFGVLDRSLLDGPGGVNFGLIKTTQRSRGIRPSFLEQTNYKSFCIDLRRRHDTSTNVDGNTSSNNGNDSSSRSPKLTLSKRPMIVENDNYIPLVQTLYRRYKAPVIHYTALASQFVVNGIPLLINSKNPLYVIFDSGTSGLIVSQELFDGRYLQERKNHEKSLRGTVDVTFTTITTNTNTSTNTNTKSKQQQHHQHSKKGGGEDEGGTKQKTITLSAIKPVTTPLGLSTPWKGFRGNNLIVIGLAFLDNIAMAIDIDDGKILFTK